MENRYAKQELCSFIGRDRQHVLKEKRVLIIGAGALGSAGAEMLVRSGVGAVTIIDRDYVEYSNLQRQHLYSESDAEAVLPKAIAAKKRLSEINSEVEVDAHVLDVTASNIEAFIGNVDVILDATDNFDIRFILNDVAQKKGIPFLFGACAGSFGSTFTIIPGKTPCLQCLLKEMPLTGATCDQVGIISPIIQIIASHQVTECLKWLIGDTEALRQTYLTVDLWNNQYLSIRIDKAKKEDCLSCGVQPTFPFLQYETQTKAAVLCGRDTVLLRPAQKQIYPLELIQKRWERLGKVLRNPFLLSCQLEHYRVVLFQDGRVFVHGTSDLQTAKNVYYKMLG